MRNQLSLYHPNAKGNGSAMGISITPAGMETGGKQGWLTITIAPQSSVGTGKTFSRFAFDKGRTIHLGIADIGELLMVFSGAQESINGWKGIKSRTADGSVSFKMRHTIEPDIMGGYVFEIEKDKDGMKDTRSFLMTMAEATAVEYAVKGALSKVAFGE